MVTMIGLIISLLAVMTWIQIGSQQAILEREMDRRVELMTQVLEVRGGTLSEQLARQAENDIASFSFSNLTESMTNATRLNAQLAYAIVMDAEGTAYAHALMGGRSVQSDDSKPADADALFAASQENRTTREVGKDESAALEFITPLKVGTARWGVLRLGFSLAALNGEIVNTRRDMRVRARAAVIRSAATAGGVVVFGMLVVAWISALISKPIRQLTLSAQQISKGDFTAATQFQSSSRDEVGVLGTAFAQMAGHLQRTYAQLEEYNRTLEEKVAERTQAVERVSAQAEEAREAAEAANRTKSAFLASMSHELRTPLTAIIGFSEMLFEEAEDDERTESAEDLRRIMDAARHLLGLINEILDLSKIEAQKMELHLERFEVANIIREVANTLEPLVAKRSNKLGSMNADLVKIRQGLFNLLSNANKFTESGDVRLAVTRVTRESGDMLSFAISDTGIGMSPEQMGRLFQAFQQADSSTSRKYGGTGLGLVITKKFCELMGGSVRVESEVGKGSTFTMEIPAEVKLPEAPPPGEERASRGPAKTVVVVLSDDTEVHQVVSESLSGVPHTLHTASNNADGVAMVKEIMPQLIALDITAEGEGGWSAMTRLKADPDLAKVPVVLLALRSADTELGITLGAAEFLAKPIDAAELKRVLERHLTQPAMGHVLLVEDDPALRELMTRTIEAQKCSVMVAENGLRALELVRQSPPKLILLDIMMPVMDGFQFLHEFRRHKEWASIPIVVLTAKTLTREEHEFLLAHTDNVIQKRDRIRDDLLRCIRDHLGGDDQVATSTHDTHG